MKNIIKDLANDKIQGSYEEKMKKVNDLLLEKIEGYDKDNEMRQSKNQKAEAIAYGGVDYKSKIQF